jgi:Cu/Ag efflux protein CusF
MKLIHYLTCCSALLLACTAWAQDAHHAGHATPPVSAAAPGPDEAVVIKADPAHQTVTLRHGEIKSLNMGPMTMDFRVADAALFARLKPGNRIRLTAGKVDGAYILLTVELVQ